MPNFLFNRFGNNNLQQSNNNNNNLINQFMSLRNNPSGILDILIQKGKITQQQYNDLQSYKNNPEAIVKYLINNGCSNEIKHAEQAANQIKH